MFAIISGINRFIREELMPNPFGFVSDNQIIQIIFTGLIGAKILHEVSFAMCGVFYNKGEAPILGSIGYMFFFVLNTLIIIKIRQWFDGILMVGMIYALLVIAIFNILYKIKERICRVY